MTINNRLIEVMNAFGLNKNQFAVRLNVHPTVVHNIVGDKGRGNKPSFDFISKVMYSFDSINGHWLLTGKGNMLLEKKDSQAPDELPVTSDKTALEMIRDLSAENALLRREIEELKRKR